jgi:hypothetical protein
MMPLLALLLVGLVELGFLLHAHVQVSSAAREAARSASLYSSQRFTSIPEDSLRGNNYPQCGTNIEGWTFQQVVEQAIVRQATITSGNTAGCPNPNGAVLYNALGRLDPARAPANTPLPTSSDCPTGNLSGWIAGVHTPAFAQSGTNVLPPRGTQATLTLCYPYRMVLLTGLLNLGDPIWIGKSVVFEYHQ